MEANFWGKMLREKGLESPGREEAVKAALEKVAERKRLKKAMQDRKAKGKGRKK